MSALVRAAPGRAGLEKTGPLRTLVILQSVVHQFDLFFPHGGELLLNVIQRVVCWMCNFVEKPKTQNMKKYMTHVIKY